MIHFLSTIQIPREFAREVQGTGRGGTSERLFRHLDMRLNYRDCEGSAGRDLGCVGLCRSAADQPPPRSPIKDTASASRLCSTASAVCWSPSCTACAWATVV